MKFKQLIQKFFTNQTVLNVITAIAFLNIIGYVILNEFVSVIYFILLGILTSFFSKNMIIVLLVPLILVNLFTANSVLSSSLFTQSNKEGMENASSSNQAQEQKEQLVKTVKKINTQKATSEQGLAMTPLDDNIIPPTNTDYSVAKTDESFEVGRSKKNSNGYNIDYASTIEDAYDQLNQILGSDGIKRLTDDTQNLMKQQLQLAESMKQMGPMIQGMAPLMKQAEGLLGSMGDGSSGLGNLVNMAKQFSAGAKQK
jgi:hypothetical protein